MRALPLLGESPFLVINGDVWCDADLRALTLANGDLASLLMVDNPDHHPAGDFHLSAGRLDAERPGVGHLDPLRIDHAEINCLAKVLFSPAQTDDS